MAPTVRGFFLEGQFENAFLRVFTRFWTPSIGALSRANGRSQEQVPHMQALLKIQATILDHSGVSGSVIAGARGKIVKSVRFNSLVYGQKWPLSDFSLLPFKV